MSLEKTLQQRSGNKCELTSSTDNLSVYLIPPFTDESEETTAYLNAKCIAQLEETEDLEINLWHCLNDSMWSEHKPVQILAWRMLNKLSSETWAQDLLEMLYLDDETLEIAKAGLPSSSENQVVHKDVNGVILNAGDSVVLIKDLKVKGSSMVAKQGTAVRRISLDPDNADYIEGKVNGQHIVIITQYVKKI